MSINYEKDSKSVNPIMYKGGCGYIDGRIEARELSNKLIFQIEKEGNHLIILGLLSNTIKVIEYKIPIKNIDSFGIAGNYNVLSNYTGGGSSIGGAAIGGVIAGGVGAVIGSFIGDAKIGAIIAGGVGAVIGSRKKIKTEIVKIDDRLTSLFYRNNNNIESIYFSAEAYNILMMLIPQKEINVTTKNAFSNSNNVRDYSVDIFNEIRQLVELKEQGILIEDEFNEKKKILLEKIR